MNYDFSITHGQVQQAIAAQQQGRANQKGKFWGFLEEALIGFNNLFQGRQTPNPPPPPLPAPLPPGEAEGNDYTVAIVAAAALVLVLVLLVVWVVMKNKKSS